MPTLAAGLGAVVRSLDLAAGSEVLVPAFSRGWARETLASHGLVVREYGLDPAHEPLDLERLAGERTGALLLAHHLGWPADGARWREWCDTRGLLLIEDVTDAWPAERDGRPVGSHGHAALFAPATTLGGERAALVRLEGREEAGAVGAASDGGWPSDVAGIAAARRGHHASLVLRLGDLVDAEWREPPPGAAPLVVPVRPADPEALLAQLRRQRVRGWRLWGQDSELVGLPVHQALTPAEVARIARAATGRPRRRPTAERLEGIEEARDDWEELGRRSGVVFSTWEWGSAWWRHLGSDRDLVLLRARRDDGSPLALMPLVRQRHGPVRVLRLAGHGVSDELGPVCAREDLAEAVDVLGGALRRLGGWDLLLAEQLPAAPGVEAMLGASVLKREHSPFAVTRGLDWDAFLASRSRNFRQQVGKPERRVAREFDLRYRLCDDPDALDADMDVFLGLHESRWGGSSTLLGGGHAAFLREIARRALERGWLRMWIVSLDGRPAAAWLAFRYADRLWAYQAGRDPAFDDQRVGLLALVQSFRAALDEGVDEYRLLRGGQTYKARFASHDHGLVTAALGRGAVGHGAVRAGAAAARIPAVRARLAGRLR